MERAEIQALLALAERIQTKIITESDIRARQCLITDLEKVKLAIADRVFDLPLEVSIFDNEMPLDVSQDLRSTDLSMTIEKLDSSDSPNFTFGESEQDDPNSTIGKNSTLGVTDSGPDFTFEPNSTDEVPLKQPASNEELAAKFQNFLKKKGATKQKSKLPVRLSK
ncbi:hypothetical protein TVAG_071660 [Trichomonas vaginalis G3]|uniref:Uncharacterized protein n=1 Tax=Trichomonas vaginalis (strain ATCC PRA-98 / G3) TaxID=412133 RepID=A2D869_TRIV3|nr:hypothetical protein TVAGG3_1046760 [Trichomonas vaginalis G3]EAY23502.1 hypothetical protein TVAG_071660 [Trichomonas vaginalis G3]KAI5493924.1 hypothetical protein TVAGG3_1046760 [Trichomonas vaginalis G3]|eukprot:XP_001584488.1 hypothetical protein [Trichomonas vaginalis G3]